ncbi:MAG TPA: low temperature requirement protein A [Burkholderiales bacterium]
MTRGDEVAARRRVSTVEVLFDLVFVFALTQLTDFVEHANGPNDFIRALVVLVLAWAVHGGYVALTSRPALIAGAAGFLVMAQAISASFSDGTLVFALAYLFVVLVHLAAAVRCGAPGRGGLALAAFGLGAALLVGLAVLVPIQWRLPLFGGGAALFVLESVLRRDRAFDLDPGRFVERHGVLAALVLGGAVVAIGTAALGRPLDTELAARIVLALVLIGAFGGLRFERDAQAMAAADPRTRGRMAILGYWYGQLVMICGVLLFAGGVKQALATAGAASGTAWLLSGGVAVYLGGDGLFRTALGLRAFAERAAAAVIALPFALLGRGLGVLAELAALSVFLAGMLALDALRSKGRSKGAGAT